MAICRNSTGSLIAELTDTVTVPKILLRYFKDYHLAVVFKQLLFWSNKGSRPDGFIYKSYDELAEEVFLSRDQVKRAIQKLRKYPFLEIKRLKANNAPTNHYKIDLQILAEATQSLDWAESPDLSGEIALTMDQAESPEPLTDNYHTITTDREGTKKKRFVQPAQDECIFYFRELHAPDPKAMGIKFFNYYGSNGWKVGKNKMVDWHKAAANWLSREDTSHGAKPQEKSFIETHFGDNSWREGI